MLKKKKPGLFNTIAPYYGLFYNWQRRHYQEVIAKARQKLDLSEFHTVLDVGCGTGALCSALMQEGLQVTGIDPAEEMLKVARNRPENAGIQFMQASAIERLPFADKEFDISIASYVAHGLQKDERKRMYAEMSRVSSQKVIIYDYNENRSPVTTVVEWFEGGDYFHFIKNPHLELKECLDEMKQCFSSVEVLNVDTRAAWYVCTPH